jgi:hypothetical protein
MAQFAFVEDDPGNYDQQLVTLRVPAGKRLTSVHLLVAARNVPVSSQRDTITLEVPSIELH